MSNDWPSLHWSPLQPDFNELAPRNGPVAVACGRVLWPRDKLDGPVAVDRNVGDTKIA